MLGKDEGSGVSVGSGGSVEGPEVDLLGDDISAGRINLFLCFTPDTTQCSGTVDVEVMASRGLGHPYKRAVRTYHVSADNSPAFLSRFPVVRCMRVRVSNRLTGNTGINNVAVLYELEKLK
jgi:hypothetical protein